MSTTECFKGSCDLMGGLFPIFTLHEATWDACERAFAKWLLAKGEDASSLVQDCTWIVIQSLDFKEERWYVVCEDAPKFRFFLLTKEDVTLQKCAVAMVQSNFYDPDAEESFGRHTDDLVRRREAVLRDETWDARMGLG